MMVLRVAFVAALCAVVSVLPVSAQERAAGGATETQMTWSTLKNLVDTARTESKGAHDRIDQGIVCNKKYKVYAPGVNGADTNGCLDNKLVKDLRTDVTVVEGDIKKIVDCNKKGQVYNGTACAVIKAESERRWVLMRVDGYKSHLSAENIKNLQADYAAAAPCNPASSFITGRTCGYDPKFCYIQRRLTINIGGQNDRTIPGDYVSDVYSCR